MKPLLVAGTAVLAAVLGAATLSAAAASPHGSNAKARVIHATAKPTHGHQVDIGRHGPSAGDQISFGGRITGGETGAFEASCVSTSRSRQVCSLVLRLSHGMITAEADYGAGGTAATPITGGTGRYAGARGVVHEREQHGGRIDQLVIDLTN